jgi:nicotinamide-nucleotide amidase
MSAVGDAALASVAVRLGRRLAAAGFKLAAAESCTGGWISKTVTDIPGSSEWFKEGFVTYSNEAKHERLGVPHSVLRKYGAVSEATARAMAAGALRRAGSDVAVAVTGIAGPGGGVPGKPVGTVWLAWAHRRGRGVQVVAQLKRFRGDREAVRRKTVRAALFGLMR